MAIQLTDIRCGCGGFCDSTELCPMRSHVQSCDCGYTSIVHARKLNGCHFREAFTRAHVVTVRKLQQTANSKTTLEETL